MMMEGFQAMGAWANIKEVPLLYLQSSDELPTLLFNEINQQLLLLRCSSSSSQEHFLVLQENFGCVKDDPAALS